MYGLAPEKLLRLVYEPFYLAISLTFYETIKICFRAFRNSERESLCWPISGALLKPPVLRLCHDSSSRNSGIANSSGVGAGFIPARQFAELA